MTSASKPATKKNAKDVYMYRTADALVIDGREEAEQARSIAPRMLELLLGLVI